MSSLLGLVYYVFIATLAGVIGSVFMLLESHLFLIMILAIVVPVLVSVVIKNGGHQKERSSKSSNGH